jgi:hypothetical protein
MPRAAWRMSSWLGNLRRGWQMAVRATLGVALLHRHGHGVCSRAPPATIHSDWWKLASSIQGDFVEEIGWPELLETVAQVRDSLPAGSALAGHPDRELRRGGSTRSVWRTFSDGHGRSAASIPSRHAAMEILRRRHGLCLGVIRAVCAGTCWEVPLQERRAFSVLTPGRATPFEGGLSGSAPCPFLSDGVCVSSQA